ncbi:MAG: hypothetical protein AAF196_19595 [Planctomycetota bacterium]
MRERVTQSRALHPAKARWTRVLGAGLAAWLLSLSPALAQDPTPIGLSISAPTETLPASGEADELRITVAEALRHGRLREARDAVRKLREVASDDPETLWLSGQVHLARGAVRSALRDAIRLRLDEPGDQRGSALLLRVHLRLGSDDEAAAIAEGFDEAAVSCAPLAAAIGAYWFKAGDPERSAEFYRHALRYDPFEQDALLRLGSGLGAFHEAPSMVSIENAVQALARDDLKTASTQLAIARGVDPEHPTVLRLLGEVEERRRSFGIAEQFGEPANELLEIRYGEFETRHVDVLVPDLASLEPRRRNIAERALSAFGSRLGGLKARRARHDLLDLDERTTAAIERRSLSGRRTFDGRLWDDVRGLGGLRAATGVEALDDAALFGFDTFAHEVAHQVHFFAFPHSVRRQIDELYARALEEECCLDGYAASSAAEYFAQGVEAFLSLAKRPMSVVTHGHTRFELHRVDRRLHDLVMSLVDHDPLAPRQEGRDRLLEVSIEALASAGKIDDAETAASWIEDPLRRALAEARCGSARLDLERL